MSYNIYDGPDPNISSVLQRVIRILNMYVAAPEKVSNQVMRLVGLQTGCFEEQGEAISNLKDVH